MREFGKKSDPHEEDHTPNWPTPGKNFAYYCEQRICCQCSVKPIRILDTLHLLLKVAKKF